MSPENKSAHPLKIIEEEKCPMSTLVEQLIKSVVEKNKIRMTAEKSATNKTEKNYQKIS